MTKLLRDTIKQIEQLSDGEQDAAAVAMLDYLAHRRDLRVSDEQLAEIRRRRADPNRTLVSPMARRASGSSGLAREVSLRRHARA